MEFKKATSEDCDLLFEWANDPVVRENSFNTNIIQYEEHKNWFFSKLDSKSRLIFIAYEEESPIGQIRIQVDGEIGIISFSIAKDQRGKGYGSEILKAIVQIISSHNSNVKILEGKVKHSNIASQKAFEKAGYSKESNTDCITYKHFIVD